MDMRNMLFGMSVITMVGVCLFLVLRYLQKRRKTKRTTQRRQNQRTSENSVGYFKFNEVNVEKFFKISEILLFLIS